MFVGLNGPPWVPDELSPVAGVTLRTPGVGFTTRLTDRVVLPALFVVLVKVTVSPYVFGVRLLAVLLIDTVTVVVAPAVKVPPVLDSVTHAAVFEAVQFNDVPPVFCKV